MTNTWANCHQLNSVKELAPSQNMGIRYTENGMRMSLSASLHSFLALWALISLGLLIGLVVLHGQGSTNDQKLDVCTWYTEQAIALTC